MQQNADPNIPFRLFIDIQTPQELHLFSYVSNDPVNHIDNKGLDIWVCSRRAFFPLGLIGNHAYLWDDRDGSCCGKGSAINCKEDGPGEDECRRVSGSSGKENGVMNCCRLTADDGNWVPYYNDCHDAVDLCLGARGLTNPGAPGGRIVPPCDPCNK